MGDTVNLAARLVARAEPGGLLATGDVLDRSPTQFETEAQPLLVKGKERAVTAYSVGRVTGVARSEAAQVLPLVGREPSWPSSRRRSTRRACARAGWSSSSASRASASRGSSRS